ncbi:MAG: DEAD/DEAH box helicase family protein [Candidatus Dormibacteria bacterium]
MTLTSMAALRENPLAGPLPSVALRDYQAEALGRLRLALSASRGRCCITLPTGCDKTVILANLDAGAYQRARSEGWASGDVASAITAAVADGWQGLRDARGEPPGPAVGAGPTESRGPGE